MPVLHVTFYTKKNCSLCEDAYALLKMLQREYIFRLEEVDIYSDDNLLEEYQLLIPAVRINETFLTCESMGLDQLENALRKNLPFV